MAVRRVVVIRVIVVVSVALADAAIFGCTPASSPSADVTPAASAMPRTAADAGADALEATPPIGNLERVFGTVQGRLRACYRKGLEVDAKMKGDLALRVSVAANGEVTATKETGGSGLDATVRQCIVRVFGLTQYDAPGEKGSTITMKLAFAP